MLVRLATRSVNTTFAPSLITELKTNRLIIILVSHYVYYLHETSLRFLSSGLRRVLFFVNFRMHELCGVVHSSWHRSQALGRNGSRTRAMVQVQIIQWPRARILGAQRVDRRRRVLRVKLFRSFLLLDSERRRCHQWIVA